MAKPLDGLRVAVLAADGFEQVEVTVPRAALRRAGADVRILSLRPGRIRGVNLLWRGRKVPVDELVTNARAEDYGALLLPGGLVSPDLLRQSEAAKEFVHARGPHDLHRFVPAMIELFGREGIRNLGDVPRRWRWAAQVSRVATYRRARPEGPSTRRRVLRSRAPPGDGARSTRRSARPGTPPATA